MANRIDSRRSGRRFRVWWLAALFVSASLVPTHLANRGAWAAAGEHIVPCDWTEPASRQLQVAAVRERAFGNILLCVEVNGIAGLMILDTGSSATFVSPRLAGVARPDLSVSITPRKGLGRVSSGQWAEATIHLGNRRWINRPVVVDDFGPLSDALGWKIDGIFGEDLLRQYRSVLIDYETNTVTFVDR